MHLHPTHHRFAPFGMAGLLVIGGWLAGGCDENGTGPIVCTTEARAGVQFTVLDDSSRSRGDATVVIWDHTFNDTLTAYPGGDNGWEYPGAWERPGSYAYRIELDGFEPAMGLFEVRDGDACHVATTRISVTLQPSGRAGP